MPKENFQIKTATGSVKIVRIGNKATITEERKAFGFKEKSVTEVTRLDDTCIHFAFDDEKRLKEMFKNH